ncbi:MAG: CDP-alcohol phosphatidyltransferase family protein [Thermacetogeniaceae bacterium]|jgi:phosphatidylglycerophosphate synthase|nr:CDP-alcohol phosphatidyltransferase family protein [Syntrophomonadaceae bacterium]
MNLPERITDAEERIRDRALKPMLDLLVPDWIYPNHITGLRIVLVSIAIIFYLRSASLAIQFWLLCAAALTDFIDGPLARLRGQCSRIGAKLDLVADWYLGIWSGVQVLLTGLLPLTIIALMVVPQLGILITNRILASHPNSQQEQLSTMTLGTAVFRARTMERLQFVTVLLGFILILYSKVTSRAIWYRFGIGALYCEIFIVWMLLFQKIACVVKQ